MPEKVKIEIPIIYLLTIACHGNMGDGELPDLMRDWAERKCEELGYSEDLHKMREEKVSALKIRLSNVLGKEMVDQLEEEISTVISLIKRNH